jgi:hypothetical protein
LSTSWLHTSQVPLPLMLNHLMAQALCARASSPLQQHSSFSTASSDRATMQMRHTASSAAMSSSPPAVALA